MSRYLKSDDFETCVAANPVTLVDFCAEWCGPCKLMAPLLETLEKEHTDITFVKLDIDDEPNFAAKHEITSVPTFIFFNTSGEVIDRFNGADRNTLKKLVEKHSSKKL